MQKKLLYEKIEADKEELFALLGSLIQINSENFGSYGSEKACAKYVKNFGEALGYETDLYSPLDIPEFEKHPDYLAGRGLEERRNCTLIVPGKQHDKRLMLAAHIDTVEIGDESKWVFPPLCGVVKDGNILGRGACDDKYGVAAGLFLIKKMKELGIELSYDLLFTGYCDEEHGGSNGALAACLKYPCDDYLNLDCKNFEIWNCGVGGGELLFQVKSNDTVDNCSKVLEGLNIVEKHLREFAERRRTELENNPDFAGTTVARNAYRIMNFIVGGQGSTDMDEGYFKITYYTDKTEKRINAELAEMKTSADAELDQLGLCELQIKKATRFFHYVKSEENNRMISLLKKAGEENGKVLCEKGACLSDLPMFVLYGSPCSVCFGIGTDFHRPGGAHQANEYVECDKLIKFTEILAGFLLEY